jgi:hypothetical protein
LLDLFGQIFILDLGHALGQYVSHYRTKYFYPAGFGGYDWKLQPSADKLIQERIRPLTLRLDADDYLKLPELIINPIYVDLDATAMSAYEEMEKELIAAIQNKDIVAASAAVATGKCSQIANGGIYDADSNYHFIHNAKTEAVQDLIGELNGSPALVAYEYGHDLTRLKAALGKDTPHIGGGVSPKQSEAIVQAWNASEIPVLLGQPASMAHGLNLQNAGNHVIWHSLTWNFEHYDQFNRRIRRQGSKHNKVFVHHIIARNTVDELKLHALNRKFRTQKDLFDALNDFLLKKRKKSFTSGEEEGILKSSQLADNKGGTDMTNKFAKKAEATEVKKEKTWTNNPEWQNPDTNDTTEAGKSKLKSISNSKAEKEEEAAPKKAAKAAPKKAETEDTRKITLVEKNNPKREGSDAYKRYELYRKAKTVKDFYAAGGTSADLRWDSKHGFVKVS